MAALNPKARELAIKVVYYGPGLGGKTSSLEHLHRTTEPDRRGKLLSLATPVDRTLFFDFLPLRPLLAPVGPPPSSPDRESAVPNVRLQLFTVPGQVYFNATRKLVLTGADGVVFVADSQPERLDANLESLENLRDNLREHGRNIDEVPLILQYNKRDLPRILPLEELEAALNPRKVPSFGTSARTGEGVREALDRVLTDVLARMGTRDVAPRSRSKPQLVALRAVEGGLSEEIARAADLARATSDAVGDDLESTPIDDVAEAAAGRDPLATEPSATLTAPGVGSVPAPAAGISFSSLWDDPQGRDLAVDVERLVAGRRYADAVLAADALLGVVVSSTAAVVGSPSDPTLAPLLLGIDARRYLGFRSLCRAAGAGETILLEHALAAYALAVDAQLALRTAL